MELHAVFRQKTHTLNGHPIVPCMYKQLARMQKLSRTCFKQGMLTNSIVIYCHNIWNYLYRTSFNEDEFAFLQKQISTKFWWSLRKVVECMAHHTHTPSSLFQSYWADKKLLTISTTLLVIYHLWTISGATHWLRSHLQLSRNLSIHTDWKHKTSMSPYTTV